MFIVDLQQYDPSTSADYQSWLLLREVQLQEPGAAAAGPADATA